MRRLQLSFCLVLVCCSAVVCPRAPAESASGQIGIFEDHTDVGTVLHPGSVDYDRAKQAYTISGSGENMWFAADAFQFLWKKMSGDVTLTADISFLTKTGNEHKKAALMLRQTLDADSVYADIALHASGMTSLQFRDEKGAITREIQSSLSAPKRLRITKRGDYVYMSLGDSDLKVAGGWIRIPLQGPFYVGLGVCSHDKDVVEQAVFSNVELTQPPALASKPTLYSTLETVDVASADRKVSYLAQGRFEAPNWTRDGNAFLFNRDGHIERLEIGTDQPSVTPALPIAAITITVFLLTRRNSLSVTTRRATASRRFMSSPSPEALRAASRRSRLPTGMGGRRMAKRWPTWASVMATLIFMRFPPPAAKRRG